MVEVLQRDVSFELERPSDMPNCLSMLARGRVDAVLGSEQVLRHLLKQNGYFRTTQPSWLILDQPELNVTLHALFPKSLPTSSTRGDRFNEALRSLRQSGRLNANFGEHHN